MATSVVDTEICAEEEDDSQVELQKLCDNSPSSGAKPKKLTSQNSLRMHRSTIRPFFCCGSELSLVSIAENITKETDIYISDDESPDTCKHVSLPIPYTNAKISRKKRHSVSLNSKYSWMSKLRGRKSLSTKPPHGMVCQCCDTDSLCEMLEDTTSSTVIATSHRGRSANKAGRKKRVCGGIQSLPRQARQQRHTDWDEIRINMHLDGWCHGIAFHNRQIVDRLCSSFQRSCELPDRGGNSVYQEFADLPPPGVIGLSISRRSSSLTAHTQVDYVHHLVPDLLEISKRSFYWGVMDRYEAERLLENKPEGTFLLRDSAQDDFLFSVSFRRYGRSLHARIEQWKHKFSFDSHDPGVYATDTVTGLIEHYKDPSCCMFFEPMLTKPLHRNFPFSLQHLCRSVICSHVTYDGINQLPVPSSIKECLKYYHYKQRVRVRKLDSCSDEVPVM